MSTIASTLTEVTHVVGLVHASTGKLIRPSDPRVRPMPYGWSVRVVADQVVISVRAGVPAPGAVPVLEVLIADPVVADSLDLPAAVPGQRARSVRVPLANPAVTVPLAPLPRTLTVVLVQHSDGRPSKNKTVKVVSTAGVDVPLPQTATKGTYRSAARVWDRTVTPGSLVVGGTTVRKVGVDFLRADTRLYVVDPT